VRGKVAKAACWSRENENENKDYFMVWKRSLVQRFAATAIMVNRDGTNTGWSSLVSHGKAKPASC
jgi:hypothetical protein